ncbi:PilL N-terminal domain-containing protein [Pseudomonas citronellolis]|uniref:PFGI-1 class ICE element type IV pilus protein PilL2 n=1 Tax=Pseudomonas citronellolis TaxID=53408 RepID=UPI0008531708|nr:PilL N-terminal domain-containing protein [Pseudomonas humi]
MQADLHRLCLLLLVALAAGCTSASPPPPIAAKVAGPATGYVPVVRYNRYTLVEFDPTAAQRDLLLQVVDVSMPDTLHASVGDGLRHVLQRSGYQLCDGQETTVLNDLPLPAAHYHLGPLQLRDALVTLAGPERTLQVDHAKRRVCFDRPLDTPDSTPSSSTGGTAVKVRP